MFNRVFIKETAKKRMSGWMGNAILVALIVMLIGGKIQFTELTKHTENFWRFLPFFSGLGLFGLAFRFLVGNVISNGGRGWFLRYWRGEYPPVSELFASFRIYTPCMVTGLLRDIYVFLWSLLFVIPGIVKHYAYSMAEYIIYENPNISASQALDMSNRMTMGYKGDLFVFDLSYLGWWILTGLTFSLVGVFYAFPYMFTAHAGVYEALKSDALRRGVLHPEDFGMMPPPPPSGNGGYTQSI